MHGDGPAFLSLLLLGGLFALLTVIWLAPTRPPSATHRR
jgi:hypothetical protein